MSRKITHEPKACGVCGVMFKKSPHESGNRFKAKLYCGHVCSAKMRKPTPPKPFDEPLKPCQHCGETMQPHADEPSRRYRERKTCNKDCGYALQRRKAGSVSGGMDRRSEQGEPTIRAVSGLI